VLAAREQQVIANVFELDTRHVISSAMTLARPHRSSS
jgi:hypothetical protein